ncbi:hypothetical protein HQQ94_15570 [Shewanella sp. VB17]|uniref:hypothetical protein n=1 Tax=Shewanella sp. VB17 TaxID=2739432 RepID=UPI001564F90B|nr:hypothetical protein [Shewanella sp. VB17]NRD74629.1 hypothetical protein [Shewanella sp. VB17]
MKDELTSLITGFNTDDFGVDIISINPFKGIGKTKIKLFTKDEYEKGDAKFISESGEVFNRYQSIKYIIRVFLCEEKKFKLNESIINDIKLAENKFVAKWIK